MTKKEEQERLFGLSGPTGDAHTLIFTEPDQERWQETTSRLCDGLTKNQLWAMCQAFHPLLRSGGLVLVQMCNGTNRPATELQGLFSQGTNKIDMSRGLALLLCQPKNLEYFYKWLSKEQRQLYQRLLGNPYITEREAKGILKVDSLVVTEKHNGYYRYNNTEKLSQPELMFLKQLRAPSATVVRYGFRQYETFLMLPVAVYPFFARMFCSKTELRAALIRDELPSSGYTVCNLEVDSVAKFPLMQGLLKAGKVQMRQKGVGLTDVKRIAKSLGLAEIFADDAVKGSAQEGLRARYWIELLAYDYHVLRFRRDGSESVETVMRNMFGTQFFRLSYMLLPLLLPHIKGLRRQLVEENTLTDLLAFFKSTLTIHPREWVDVAGVLQQSAIVPACTTETDYLGMVFSPANMSDSADLTNEYNHKQISADSFFTEFGLTVLQAFSLMLCSLGVAEVALSSLHRPESPFARVECLRLTALGRYALGIDSTYEAPHFDQQVYFELDPERLIIRSLVNPNPYEQLLKDSSVRISTNRYETSASSFLANCKSKDDVEKNITIFRQFISSDLPPLWKQFFDSLLQHCHPLKKDATSYQHYVVEPDNTDLIRLLTSDEKLRQLVVRAEGYRILVRVADQAKFESRLKQFGYLL